MIKKGFNYVAAVEVSFSSLAQAEDFCNQQTMIGKTVAEDLKCDTDEELDELEDLFAGDGISCAVDFEDGFTEAVQKELTAAAECGAEFTLTLKWVPNE
jgi:hypothetical protein